MERHTKFSSISFFCPAHNEEKNLPVLIPVAHEYFKNLTERFEILIIENGSSDSTAKVADELAEKYPEVRTIHYPYGLGYGGALREGFNQSKYDYVCYTDGDNQYDIREFKEGFELMSSADIASGYVRKKAVSTGRKIQSSIWNIVVRILFGVSLRDINCSMKIYKRKVLKSINIASMSAFIDAEMLIRAKRAGFSIAQFPVTHYERTAGEAIGSSPRVIGSTIIDTIKFWLNLEKDSVILFSLAFIVRALYAFLIQISSGAHGFISFSDAQYFYYAAAKNLLSYHAFSIAQTAPFYPDAYHTPLYPLFISALLSLHVPLFGIVLVQDILAATTTVFIYRIALRLSNSRSVSFIAAFVAALEPISIYWSGLLMSDVFFAFLAVWSMYLFIRHRYVASSLILGLSALVRPITLFFLPVYLLYLGYAYIYKKEPLRTALIVALVFSIVVAPWFARNKILFNTWSFTSAGWYDLYMESVMPFAEQRQIPLTQVNAPSQDSRDFTRFNFEYTPIYQAADLAVIKAAPLQYFSFQMKRSLWSLISDRYEYLVHDVIASQLPGVYMRLMPFLSFCLSAGQVFWFCIYFFVICSLFERKLRPWWFFFAALVAINAVISGGINPGGTDMSRYSLPFYAFFFTFALVGGRVLWQWRARHIK
jgi:glycosyltransferase involved in cell wall biosynthesis